MTNDIQEVYMREIKFRAWNVQKKQMYYATPYRGYIKSNGSWWGLYNGDDVEVANSGSDKLMQYTGLKDKNGVEIYEGDIVEIVQPKQSNMWMGSSLLSSHSWENKYRNVVQWQNDNNPRWDGLLVWGGGTIEVLGNIYESKELLDEQ